MSLKEKVQKQLTNLQISEKDRELAERNITRLIKKDKKGVLKLDEDTVQRFCALKLLGKERVRVDQLRRVCICDEASAMLQKKFKIVKKASKPDLDKKLPKEAFADPMTLQTFPHWLKRDEVWVVDGNVDRNLLGFGTFTWKTSVGSRMSIDLPSSGSAPKMLKTGSLSPDSESERESNSADEECQALVPEPDVPRTTPIVADEPQAKKTRLLEPHDSDPEQKSKRELQSAEKIAVATTQCADDGLFFSADPNQYNTVEGWLRCHVDCLEDAKRKYDEDMQRGGGAAQESFESTLADHVRRYIAFVTKCLLRHRCYKNIKHFSKQFEKVRGICPALVPPVTELVIRIANYELQSTKAVDMTGFAFEKKQIFLQSVLYSDFLGAKALSRFSCLKLDHDGAPQARLDGVRDLLEQSNPEMEAKSGELHLAIMFLGDTKTCVRLHYLFEDYGRFDILRAWLPGERCLVCEPFASKTFIFKGMKPDHFRDAAMVLLECDGFDLAKVAHPVARQVLTDHRRLRSDVQARSRELNTIVDAMLVEVAALKLGVTRLAPNSVSVAPSMQSEVVDFPSLVGNTWRKMILVEGSTAAAINELVQKKRSDAELSPEGTKPSPEVVLAKNGMTGGAGTAENTANAAAVKSPEPSTTVSAAAVEPAEEMAKTDATPEKVFVEGDFVRIKFKAKEYDGYKGRIVRVKGVLNLRYIIVVLEGPKKNQEKEFGAHNVLPWQEQKKIMSAFTDSRQSHDAEKMAERAEFAAALFGSTEDM